MVNIKSNSVSGMQKLVSFGFTNNKTSKKLQNLRFLNRFLRLKVDPTFRDLLTISTIFIINCRVI